MDAKNLIENFFLQNDFNIEILEIFKTGSSFLNKQNPSDLDYVVICDNISTIMDKGFAKIGLEYNDKKYSFVIVEKEYIKKVLKFEANMYKDYHLYNYFYAIRKPEFGSAEVNFDFFENKEAYLKIIKSIYDDQVKTKNLLGKHMVHYYIILALYENGSLEITEEIQNTIDLLYDITDEHHEILLDIHNKLKEL